jgi:hypothetical protein
MKYRILQSFLAATMLGMALSAAAQTTYPITSRSGTTTVTGVYRPLDLDLQLDSGLFFYDQNDVTNQSFSLTAQMSGNYTSTYGASGNAGLWTLNLGFNTFNNTNYIRNGSVGSYTSSPILDSNVFDQDNGSNTIELRLTAADRPVGTLVYQSGLTVASGTLPANDTPAAGDMFLLYAHNAGKVLSVDVEGSIANPTNFYLELAQSLFHLGPYVQVDQISVGIGNIDVLRDRYALDDGSLTGATRVNADCNPQGRPGCGSVPERNFFASSVQDDTLRVPEPASALLVGVALLGLAAVRRRRA